MKNNKPIKRENKKVELPEKAEVILKIAERLGSLTPKLPKELIFKAIVQALYGEMEL